MLKRLVAATVIVVAAAATAPTPASAKPCAAWSTSDDQREEGKAWTASVCATSIRGRGALLEVVCFGDQLNVRFDAALPADADPGEAKRDFEFTTSSRQQRISMGFEGMDGAFTAYLTPNHPLFAMLMSGNALAVDGLVGGTKIIQRFSLKGSRAAIGKLKRSCRKPGDARR